MVVKQSEACNGTQVQPKQGAPVGIPQAWDASLTKYFCESQAGQCGDCLSTWAKDGTNAKYDRYAAFSVLASRQIAARILQFCLGQKTIHDVHNVL